MRMGKLLSCFIVANLAYDKRRSEDRVTDPRSRQIKTLILPRCPKARGNIDFDHACATLTGSRLRIIKRFSSRRL